MTNNTLIIVNALSELILQNLAGASREQYYPQAQGPDEMDERIKQGKETAARLRQIREQFENAITGIIL